MASRTLKQHLQAFGVNRALDYIKEDPETSLPKLIDWFDKIDKNDVMLGQRKAVREVIEDKDNNWHRYMMSLWDDIDTEVRQTFLKNFVVNASLIATQQLNESRAKHDCNVPWAILMDPTSACNLGCTGCWAAEYGDKLSLDLKTLDDIITQGKELGTYMYVYSGGEPLVRKKDIITLCEKHDDCMFLAFTNATLIDEEFADEMLRVKNFVPAISIEGFEQETDDRRGQGTYQKVLRAMEILRQRKLIFGASVCYTSKNTEVVGSEAYFDDLIEKGCKFAWFFTYMPVGVGSPTELIATDKQREYMYHQIRQFRNTKPIFTIDFWNDGEYVNGCIAGGRNYLHINANGDVEPCAFIHYADTNIHESTLLDALKGPLFQQYRQNQPFNENHLRPCPLLDNNGKLAEMVHASGAHSTDMSAPEDVDELCAKCKHTADRWTVTADRLWMPNREEAI